MLWKGTLHACEPNALEDGSYLAVTLINRPPHGVMAWAGRLLPAAIDKPAIEIDVSDYVASEKVSFSTWHDVWEYFAPREYATLTDRLRAKVARLDPDE